MLRALCILGTIAAIAVANAQLYGLSSSNPGSLYTLNPNTGAATFVTDVSGTDGVSLTGLEFLGGTLYATDVAVGTTRRFGTIDPGTGAFTAINTQNGNLNWASLAADEDANLLYAFALGQNSGGDLVSITPSGAITTIGTNGQSLTGLAFDNRSKILYGVSPSQLFRVDVATGAATLIGDLGLSNSRTGLAYDDATETLYLNLGQGGPASNALYRVSPVTGAATLIGANGPTNGFGIDGLAFRSTVGAVPEPASLLALGGGLAALVRRRRRRA